jgi:hypothetical protein
LLDFSGKCFKHFILIKNDMNHDLVLYNKVK